MFLVLPIINLPSIILTVTLPYNVSYGIFYVLYILEVLQVLWEPPMACISSPTKYCTLLTFWLTFLAHGCHFPWLVSLIDCYMGTCFASEDSGKPKSSSSSLGTPLPLLTLFTPTSIIRMASSCGKYIYLLAPDAPGLQGILQILW